MERLHNGLNSSSVILIFAICISVITGCATTPDPRMAAMRAEAVEYQKNNKELYKKVVKAYYNYERVLNSPKFEAGARLAEAQSYFTVIGLDHPEFKETSTYSWIKARVDENLSRVIRDVSNASLYVVLTQEGLNGLKSSYDF